MLAFLALGLWPERHKVEQAAHELMSQLVEQAIMSQLERLALEVQASGETLHPQAMRTRLGFAFYC